MKYKTDVNIPHRKVPVLAELHTLLSSRGSEQSVTSAVRTEMNTAYFGQLKQMYFTAFRHENVSLLLHNSAELSTGLFISLSGISGLDCATTKTDTAERSISLGRESL